MQLRIPVYLMCVLIPMNIMGQVLHWNDTVTTENQLLRVQILFAYNSSEILAESKPMLDSITDFINKNEYWIFEIGVHNDTRGSDNYSIKLTAKRAENLRKTLILKGVEEYRVVAKGYEGSAPLISKEEIIKMNSADQEIAHAKNRRTELRALRKCLVPDWSAYPIAPNFKWEEENLIIGLVRCVNIEHGMDMGGFVKDQNDAEHLAKWLLNNPNITIEISFNTDIRGDKNYNQELSERRANALRLYLASKGVKPEQFSCVGYGETNNIISEKDIALMCPPDQEKAHQINRRTEIKILKI